MAQNRRQQVVPRVKVWLEFDGKYVFGFGISNILKAVDETGSIKDAALSLGKSYRHVWARIKRVEADLGASLVETKVGGGDPKRSVLTDDARRLCRDFDQLRDRMHQVISEEFAHRCAAINEL